MSELVYLIIGLVLGYTLSYYTRVRVVDRDYHEFMRCDALDPDVPWERCDLAFGHVGPHGKTEVDTWWPNERETATLR